MPNQCPLCERPQNNDSSYCAFHTAALANLDKGYLAWKKAFGDMTKAEYFVRLEALPETGQAVKNLIHHLHDGGAIA